MRRRARIIRRATLLAAAGAVVALGHTQAPAAGPLDALTYKIQTVYKTPGGTLVERTSDGLLLVPTPVDVDGDVTTGLAGAEVLAQLSIDAGRATFRVTRPPLATGSLPLKIEAILADPRGTSTLRVAFGYDALETGAPSVYSATIHLLGAARVTSFGLDVETVGAGPSIDVTAEVYSEGTGGQRLEPQRGRVTFSPVPTVVHFSILQGNDVAQGLQQSGFDVTTDTPTKIDVLIEDIQANRSTIGTATLDRVPHVASLVLTDSDDGRKTWDYHATDRIELITLDITDRANGNIVEAFALRLEDMARNVVLVQDTPTHATLQADSPIGAIQAGTANGRAVAWLNEPAYLYSTDDGNADSFAFRIQGLERAELDTGDPFIVDVTVAAGPLHVLIEERGRTIDAMIRDLPHEVRFELSPTAGTISYEGSDVIERIDLVATDPDGLTGRAKRLVLAVDDVPRQLSLAFGANGGRAVLDAHSARVGRITLLLTSGPDLAVDDGFDGVVLHDVPDRYVLAARLTGLQLVSVTTGDPPYELDLRKTSGPFLIHILQDSRDLRIEVHDLPAEMQATFDPAGSLEYTASSTIGLITADLNDPEGITGRATKLALRLSDMPKTLGLSFTGGSRARIDAGAGRIGRVDLLLTSGPVLAMENGFDGVIYEDVPGHETLVVRLTGLRLVDATTVAPYALDLRKDAGPFLLRIAQDARRVRFEAHDLPDSVQMGLDPSAGTLSYDGSAVIGRLTATITDPAGVTGRATSLRVTVEGLPTTVDLSYGSAGAVSIDAHGAAIGLVDILATSGPSLAVDSGFDGVVLEEQTSHYAFAVRLRGLRLVSAATAAPYALDLRKAAGPFLLRLDQGARHLRVEAHDLPDSVQVTLDPDAGTLSYDGSATMNRLTALLTDPAGVTGRVKELRLLVQGLPTNVDLSFTAGTAASIDANGAAIGLVDILATSGPNLAVDNGFDGVVLEDLPSHYAFAVRLNGLKLVSASTAAPYALTIQKAAGPFLLRLAQGNRTVRVEIHDLPDSIEATLDPGAGTFAYNGSAVIGRLTADIVDPAGITGRITKLALTVEDLPKQVDLSYAAGATASIDAHGAAIGLVDILATSGPTLTVPAGFDGIVLEDLTDRYAFAVRLRGLKLVSASTASPYALTVQKAAGPFLLQLDQGPRHIRLEARDLPDSVQATLDTAAGRLTYSGSSTIGRLDALVRDPAGVSGRATLVRARIDGIPTSLTLQYLAGAAATIDAHGSTVALIDVLATSGPELSVDAGFDGVVLEDLPSHYAFAVRLTGLKVVSISTGAAPYRLLLQKSPGPFVVRLLQGARRTEFSVRDLPSSLDATLNPAGSLAYTASATIGRIDAEIVDPAGVTGRATRATALLTSLPTTLDLSWAAAGGGTITADAKGQTLGLLEVLLTNGPTPTLPASQDGVIVNDVADFSAFARITGLRKATFAQGPPPSITLDTTGGREFVVSVQTAKPGGIAVTTATITTLPASLSLTFSSPTVIRYSASAPVALIQMDAYDPAGISGRATALHGLLQSLPTRLDVSWGTGGTIGLDAFGGTVGLVEVQLTSGPDDRLATQYDGFLLRDVADRYVVFARLTGLRKVVATQGQAPDILVETTGNRVLRADVLELAGGKETYTRATLDRLPSSARLRLVDTGRQEIFYNASAATNSLTFETNAGDRWAMTASLANPLPATVYFCQASNNACGGSGRGSNAGSATLTASGHTTINLFDCVRPASSSCPGGADEYIRVTNLRARRMTFDGNASGSGESGHIYLDTDNHELTGNIHIIDGSSGFDAQFNSGFRSENRLGTWSLWGLFKDKSGSVTCNGSLDIRFLGIWIGVTSYLC